MASLADPERLKHYTTCLSFWRYDCYVHFKSSAAERLLAELDGMSLRGLGEFLHKYMQVPGHFVKEVRETREEYKGVYEFHYDFNVVLPSGNEVYIETVLEIGSEPEDSMIMIVSIHP